MTTTLKSECTHGTFVNRSFRILLFGAIFMIGCDQMFGLGFRIPNQDPAAIARGNAFVATADNPSAIYYNPAGITQLEGQNIQVGLLNYMGINTRYEPSGAGSGVDSKFEVIPVPQLHYVYSPTNCQFSFGVGLYAPFGLGVEWPDDSSLRQTAIESRLQYLTLNPVVAWKPHPTLSIAAGPLFNYSEIKFNRGLLAPMGDFFEFKGDDYSVGFNAGVLWQPFEQWSFGANYRSASTMHYEGKSKYKSPVFTSSARTEARVPFPQIVSAGVSYRPTPKWNIEVNVDYTDWTTLNTVKLDGTRNMFGFDLPLQLDWHESWFYELGVTRYFDNGWFVSGGYFYSGETSPERTFTPAVPDTELHVGSVGVGHKGEHWSWTVAVQVIAGPAREISSSPSAPPGTYQLFVPTVSFSAGYHF